MTQTSVDYLIDQAAELFAEGGLTRHTPVGLPLVWANESGDVWPYFAPSVVRRRGALQLLGVVGVHVPQFELWWRELLEAYPATSGVGDTTLFGCFITNFLVSPPSFSPSKLDRSALHVWTKQISEKIAAFPLSIGDLRGQLARRHLGVDDLSMFVGHAVKARAFEIWMEGLGLEVVVPTAAVGIHPYEKISSALRDGVRPLTA